MAARHIVRLKRARPHRPQTNGKAQRFIQPLIREWAYVRSYTDLGSPHPCAAAVGPGLQRRASHAALGYQPPCSRFPRVAQ